MSRAGSGRDRSGPKSEFGASTGSEKNFGYGAATATENTSGRKIVQSAKVSLDARSGRINAVAQEIFNLVTREHGIVNRSHVDARTGRGQRSTASFRLSIPSAKVQSTLNSLSSLRYASVISSSAATRDVTDRDNARRDALGEAVNYTSVQVQVSSRNRATVAVAKASGFTLARAGHDAGRVLVVAAGVALIGLAAMVPLVLLLALIGWIAYRLRRRLREQALDRL